MKPSVLVTALLAGAVCWLLIGLALFLTGRLDTPLGVLLP